MVMGLVAQGIFGTSNVSIYLGAIDNGRQISNSCPLKVKTLPSYAVG